MNGNSREISGDGVGEDGEGDGVVAEGQKTYTVVAIWNGAATLGGRARKPDRRPDRVQVVETDEVGVARVAAGVSCEDEAAGRLSSIAFVQCALVGEEMVNEGVPSSADGILLEIVRHREEIAELIDSKGILGSLRLTEE